MAEISGVLHHFGKKDRGAPYANLYASADHQSFYLVQADGTVTIQHGTDDPGAYGKFKVDGQLGTVRSEPGGYHTFVLVDVSGIPA
jgi:hypothetical protein